MVPGRQWARRGKRDADQLDETVHSLEISKGDLKEKYVEDFA
jgi:hypothetical protein